MDHQEPLIPLASRPFAPAEHQDSSRETLWHNPTDRDITVDVHTEVPRAMSTDDVKRPPRTWEEKTGKRRYVFKAGETRALPAEFDLAIQHTQCMETDCTVRPFDCRDPKHQHQIIGGLAPALQNKGSQTYKGTRKPDVLAPGLDDAEARKRAAQEEIKEQLYQEHLARQSQASAQAAKDQADADIDARTSRATGDAKPAKNTTK